MNGRKPEVEPPVTAAVSIEVPRSERAGPVPRAGASRAARRERREVQVAGARETPRSGNAPCSDSFLFDDPYWDDAFDSYHDPTLRTCCRF